jgi:hypothetical protein
MGNARVPPQDLVAALPWLLLVYQVPTSPSNLRVKTWRRLQRIGAVPLRNSAYVLPDSAQAREDFAWLKAEILAMRGQACIFTAEHLDEATGADVVMAFRQARAKDFRDLSAAIRNTAGRVQRAARGSLLRRRLEVRARALRARLLEIEALDPFGAPGGEEARSALDHLDRLLTREQPAKDPARPGGVLMKDEYRHRVWVTRPRPGVDRMSSAWLIQRFIDPRARFVFAEKPPLRGRAVPFDMFGVEFGHQGDSCTFETLAQRFAIRDPAVGRIAQVVHNLDLKEEKYAAPEAAAVGRLVEGLRSMYSKDQELLAQGMRMFEALYQSLSAVGRGKPKPVGRSPASKRRDQDSVNTPRRI